MMPFFAIDTECGDENSLYFKRNLTNTTVYTHTPTIANTTVHTHTHATAHATANATTNATAHVPANATTNASMNYVRSTPSILRDTLNDIPIGYRTHTFCHFSNEFD